MDDTVAQDSMPSALQTIERDTDSHGVNMASDRKLEAFLRVLAASKPKARMLELGTGTGLSAAWLLDGMNRASTLFTVDNDASCVASAQRHLAHDPRIRFCIAYGSEVLRELRGSRFDLIFADAWPGKFWDIDLSLDLVAPVGFYIADEPTGNLPSEQGRSVMEALRGLNEQGMTVLVVTHDPGVASWSDRLLVLRDGEIVSDEASATSHFLKAQTEAWTWQRLR